MEEFRKGLANEKQKLAWLGASTGFGADPGLDLRMYDAVKLDGVEDVHVWDGQEGLLPGTAPGELHKVGAACVARNPHTARHIVATMVRALCDGGVLIFTDVVVAHPGMLAAQQALEELAHLGLVRNVVRTKVVVRAKVVDLLTAQRTSLRLSLRLGPGAAVVTAAPDAGPRRVQLHAAAELGGRSGVPSQCQPVPHVVLEATHLECASTRARDPGVYVIVTPGGAALPGDDAPWACPICTYDNKGVEAMYLQCAMCTAPAPEVRRARPNNQSIHPLNTTHPLPQP